MEAALDGFVLGNFCGSFDGADGGEDWKAGDFLFPVGLVIVESPERLNPLLKKVFEAEG